MLALSIAVATLVRLRHIHFVPIWDGRVYWDDCAQAALSKPFDPLAFNCFGHRSMLYMLTVTWPQYFDHGSAVLLNLAHLAVSLLTLWAFYRVLVRLAPPGDARASGVAAGLGTLVFACSPAWTAASINFNPDSGVLTAFLFALSFLLGGRRVAATVAGIFLVLSKEIGLLLWMALAVIDTVAGLHARGPREFWRVLLHRAHFAVPAIAYVAVGIGLAARGLPSTWTRAESTSSLLWTFLSFDLTDRVFRAYVADLTVLNFAWVMTTVSVIWLSVTVVAVMRRRPLPLAPELDRHAVAVTAAACAAALFLCTRYPTFNNVRYLLPAFAAMAFGFVLASVSLFRQTALRATILLLAGALQLVSMWNTVDPVSKATFGTFRFGDHELLNMTSITGECCGFGRDQLVYNLQFTAFDDVQNEMFRRWSPRDRQVIGMHHLADWYIVGLLDARTGERTMRSTGTVRPRELSLNDFLAGEPLPARMRYVVYPNVPDTADLALLARAYHVAGPYQVEHRGYRLAWYDLRARR